jgi:two-component system response regulator HydG
MRILIVDDDFVTLKSLRAQLERMGHSVRVATDGESALRMAKDPSPDVALVDLLLSFENGLDVIEKLRPVLPRCYLALMTSWPGDEIIYEAEAAGADVFVAKEELPGALSGLLQHLERRLQEDESGGHRH